MKQITRGIIGTAGVIGAGTFIGTVGGTVIKKAAETYCKTPGGQLAVYSIGCVGYMITVYPVIKNVAQRITDWVMKPEYDKFVDEVNKRCEELLKKKEEES